MTTRAALVDVGARSPERSQATGAGPGRVRRSRAPLRRRSRLSARVLQDRNVKENPRRLR
jgi:hypothetical protein